MRTGICRVILISAFLYVFISLSSPLTLAEGPPSFTQPPSLPKAYILGPDDVVDISVDLLDDISGPYTITPTGMIEFPTLLQPLRADGLTVKQLRETLVEQLKFYMHDPAVTVRVQQYRSHKVLLLGPFVEPGSYHLTQEEVPLLDLILEAGGLSNFEARAELVVFRQRSASPPNEASNPQGVENASRSITVNLDALLRGGDIAQNVMIQSGDVIYLSSFFQEQGYIYVTGGRQREAAALVPYEHGLTLLKALFKASIILEDINIAKVKILRGGAGEEQILTVGLKGDSPDTRGWATPLQPEDIIVLPEADTVYVTGAVKSAGAIPYQDGLTLLRAILETGGFTPEALSSEIHIVREGVTGQENPLIVNVDAALEGDKTQDLSLKAGDIVVVPEKSLQHISVIGAVNLPGLIPYEKGLTLHNAIARAGGFSGKILTSQIQIRNEAASRQVTQHLDFADPTASDKDIPLQPGDLVIVLGESPSETVSVLGNVLAPGAIEFKEGLTILRAILTTGGLTRDAQKSNVRIVRGEGENQQAIPVDLETLMDDGDKSQNILLQAGDIVIVP